MKKLLTLFLACSFIPLLSQTTSYSLHLFYNINESLSGKNFARVDSFCSALPALPAKITLTGYADFLSSANYNLQLSQKRADLIKDHLLQGRRAGQFTILSSTGMGASASKKISTGSATKDGEPAQRRVDLLMEMQSPPPASPTVIKQQPQPEAPLAQKTTPGITLEELKEGESLELEGLSFKPGRHVVLKSSLPILKKLLETLKNNPTLKIEIQGHVCCAPGPQDSFDYDTHDSHLSTNRAKEVYDYLIANGIDRQRLSYKGFGHSKPKVEELNTEDEQVNRRVEVLVVGN